MQRIRILAIDVFAPSPSLHLHLPEYRKRYNNVLHACHRTKKNISGGIHLKAKMRRSSALTLSISELHNDTQPTLMQEVMANKLLQSYCQQRASRSPKNAPYCPAGTAAARTYRPTHSNAERAHSTVALVYLTTSLHMVPLTPPTLVAAYV